VFGFDALVVFALPFWRFVRTFQPFDAINAYFLNQAYAVFELVSRLAGITRLALEVDIVVVIAKGWHRSPAPVMPGIDLSVMVASAANAGLAFIPCADIGIDYFLCLVCPIAEWFELFQLGLDNLAILDTLDALGFAALGLGLLDCAFRPTHGLHDFVGLEYGLAYSASARFLGDCHHAALKKLFSFDAK